jgi:hypothetical protein
MGRVDNLVHPFADLMNWPPVDRLEDLQSEHLGIPIPRGAGVNDLLQNYDGVPVAGAVTRAKLASALGALDTHLADPSSDAKIGRSTIW